MTFEQLKQLILDALENLKAVELTLLDVSEKTSFTDLMVIAVGRSSRHVKSLADEVISQCKKAGVKPLGTEGEREGNWVLVDLGDIVVHVMQPEVKEYYNLEKLWEVGESTLATLRAE